MKQQIADLSAVVDRLEAANIGLETRLTQVEADKAEQAADEAALTALTGRLTDVTTKIEALGAPAAAA